MNNPINNTIFDTRDLVKYFSYLENFLAEMWNDYVGEVNEEDDPDNTAKDITGVDLTLEGFYNRFEDDIEEYYAISDFVDELSDAPDFDYGETVVSDAYWVEYCEELCKDCGYISSNFPSWIEVDWEATAENISADYKKVNYLGDDYYIRL